MAGKIPPGAKRVAHAVVAGAAIGAATGGMGAMLHEFGTQPKPSGAARPQPQTGGYAENVRQQRHYYHHRDRH